MKTTKEQRNIIANSTLDNLVQGNIIALLKMSAQVKLCSEDENDNVFVDIAFKGSENCNRVRITILLNDSFGMLVDVEYYNYTVWDGKFEIVSEHKNLTHLELKDNFEKVTGLSL